MKHTSLNESRIIFLDYLRIFAFISVFIGHKFYDTIISVSTDNDLPLAIRIIFIFLESLVWGGGSGVIVFFLISGYIISYVLTKELPISFIIRRIFRIYPLYIIAVFIQIALSGWHFPPINIFIPQLLLIGNFFGTPYTLNGVEWTLRVEIIFYLFMAIIKISGFWGEKNKTFSQFYFILLFLMAVISQLPPFPSEEGFGKGYFSAYTPILLMGVGFWLVEAEKIKPFQFVILESFGFIIYSYLTSYYTPLVSGHHFAILGVMLFTLSWYWRRIFMNNRYITFFSNLTYSVYLCHNWLFDIFKDYLINNKLNLILSKTLATILLFISCYLLYRFIEQPANKLGRKISIAYEVK